MRYLVLNAVPILLAGLAGLLPLALAWRQTRALAVGFPASAWVAAILAGALIIAPVPAGVWTVTLVTALILWIGFILPALLATMLARGLPPKVVAIDCAAWLAALVLQAVVLRLIGLVPP